MIETGEVVKIENDEAVVKIERHSMCSKCNNKCRLADGMNHESDEINIRVSNDLQAKKGEKVELEMHERPLVVASLVIYLVPILFIIAGYFFTDYILSFFGFASQEYLNIIGSLFFLLLAFKLVSQIDNYFGRHREYQPIMIKILDR